MNKSCHNCQHLELFMDDDDYLSSWDCNKRHEDMYKAGREQELLENLDREEYRNKSKRCCELKEAKSL